MNIGIMCLAFLFSAGLSVPVIAENNFPDWIISREKWGAEPFIAERMEEHQIKTITIHHAGVLSNPDRTPDNKAKSLQAFSQNQRDWGDNPYHFMIYSDGSVLEARPLKYAGDTNTAYDPRSHFLICVDGNFEEEEITPAAWEKLIDLCVWACTAYSIDPASIKTHKDYVETLCPGKTLYEKCIDGSLLNGILQKMNPEQAE